MRKDSFYILNFTRLACHIFPTILFWKSLNVYKCIFIHFAIIHQMVVLTQVT